MADFPQVILEPAELGRTLRRMAHEIVENCPDAQQLVLIGIRSRGVYLARRLARNIEAIHGLAPAVAVIDVSPFRDDRNEPDTRTASVEIQAPIEDKTIILIDDVIYRGRTIRAALEAVERLGQPRRILVAALIDRGARELPIRADIVGKNIEAAAERRVNVRLIETDGVDHVSIDEWPGVRGN